MSATMIRRILLVLVSVAFSHVFCGKYKSIQVEIKTKDGEDAPKIFTAEEIAKYDGTDDDMPIYLAIKGVVFDVSSGKGFYNKKSDYNILTGKDASRAHALWSLEKKDLNHDLTGLTDDQLQGLDEVYTGTYLKKYPVVGYMDYLVDQQSEDVKKRLTNEEL